MGRAAVRPLSELCRTRLCWTATGTGARVEVAGARSARSEVFHGSTREAGSQLRRRRRFARPGCGQNRASAVAESPSIEHVGPTAVRPGSEGRGPWPARSSPTRSLAPTRGDVTATTATAPASAPPGTTGATRAGRPAPQGTLVGRRPHRQPGVDVRRRRYLRAGSDMDSRRTALRPTVTLPSSLDPESEQR